ncbi:hypothetical protein CHARACLAT_020437 [Characodon lateralis]|uniref:Uncharacterized protein n=1 Tax=Characodon lateralis TaxID=208331 RepID=A0ABU7F4K4_9TELE|nr:hypothetical protein [Characodon lateralis]
MREGLRKHAEEQKTGGNNFNSVLNPPGSRHPAVTWRTHGLLRQQKHRDSAYLELSFGKSFISALKL